jgi:hypothetical protein
MDEAINRQQEQSGSKVAESSKGYFHSAEIQAIAISERGMLLTQLSGRLREALTVNHRVAEVLPIINTWALGILNTMPNTAIEVNWWLNVDTDDKGLISHPHGEALIALIFGDVQG